MFKKCLKSIWFWSVFLPLLYTLCGFFLLPWLAVSKIPPLLKEQLNLDIRIEKMAFNPFTFELKVDHLSLHDETQKKVIGFEHIYVNYEPSFLFKKEIFIQSVSIDTPSLDAKIDENGSLNLMRIFASMPTTAETNTTEKNDTPLPFLIGQIDIKNGDIFFQHERTKEPFSVHLGPLNYTITNLGLQKDDLSIHALKSVLQNEEKISLASSVALDPLKLHGKLEIKQIGLPPFWTYLMEDYKATLKQGDLSLYLPFSIDFSKETPLISIEKANLSLEKVIIQDEKQKKLISIPKLSIDDINFEWPKAQVSIDSVAILEPFIDMELEKNYELNLVKLFVPAKTNTKTTLSTSKETPIPWSFLLKKLTLTQGQIDFLDTNVKQNGKTKFSEVTFGAQNITLEPKQAINYDLSSKIDDKSQLKIKGSVIPQTIAISASIETTALSIAKIQPYLEPFTTLSLKEGLLSLKAKLDASFEEKKDALIKLDTSLDLSKLVINDSFNQPIIAWDKLLIDTLAYNTAPNSLHVGKITLNKPYVNLDIKKDKSSNFTNILKPIPTTKSTQKSQPKEMEIVFGTMSLKGGSANFKDASLPIPFATFINNLNGTFSALNTKNTKPSKLLLEGKVDKYGYSKIEGSILPFAFKDNANLKILFKNIDMPSLTPYSGKFVGYAIQKGKLSMDLSYKIKKGMMEGANKINIDSLTLGDKIESEDATNLPLGLAIAILKDSKGQIDLNLPVSGDLNDPDFKYGAIVWKAFGNLIGSILTSPFSLIGSLLGIETETLKSVEFSGGEYQIIASEEEKMDQYRQILEKKPELKLIITPSFNEEVDTLAIRENAIERQIEAITKGSKEENSYGKAIKTLFVKKFSQDAYDNLIKGYKDEKLDFGTIHENFKSKIALTLVITPEELNTLAHQRADAIIQNLTQIQKIASPKILKGELKSSDAIRESWVGCEVTISN
ncbi:MAG: DUF748 domain-containing protein [Sulfurospirillaceae bacterium]|nr:DUF748 domain-containing protein [Sulfurospirillaceae bacterium]